MNKNVAYISLFATGLALGGGGGYLLAQKKFRLLTEAEVESVRVAFHELQKINREAAPTDSSEPSDTEGTSTEQFPRGLSQQPRTQASDREFVEYNKIVAGQKYVGPKGKPGPATDSEVDPRIVEETPVQAVEVGVNEKNEVDVRVTYEEPETAFSQNATDDLGPVLVDVGDFINNENDYDQISMTWYAGDQTLIFDDEPDQMVDDLSIVGGLSYLRTFGADAMNDCTIYVRDDKNEKLYEIVRDTRRFSAGMGS